MQSVIVIAALIVFLLPSVALRAQNEASLRAYGVQADGERVSNVRIVREELERTTLLPLLPYVFFAKGSASLPDRYVQLTPDEAKLFDVREFTTRTSSGSRSAITAYYNVLNIVGRRLILYPAMSLTVQGSAAADEDAGLAEQRALTVVRYLETRFPGAKGRVRVGEHLRSKSAEADVRFTEESRRVALVGNWEITRPVVIRDTSVSVTPPMLDFEVSSSLSRINELQLTVWQSDADSPLFSYIDVELPRTPIRWDLEHDPEHQPKAEDVLSAQLVITDSEFRKFLSGYVRIPVDQYSLYRKKSGKVVGGKEIHQYNLILFDRNSSELRPDHIRIIDSVIAEDGYVLPTSRVRVIGYADSTGSQEVNRALSSNRAQQAADRLFQRFGDVISQANVDEIRGVGSTDVLGLPDGQSTPEARFYSRTVFIIIESAPSW